GGATWRIFGTGNREQGTGNREFESTHRRDPFGGRARESFVFLHTVSFRLNSCRQPHPQRRLMHERNPFRDQQPRAEANPSGGRVSDIMAELFCFSLERTIW